MTRFLFHVEDGFDVRDRVGREIDGPLALRREALRVAARPTADEAEDAKPASVVLTVRDDAGRSPLRVRLVCQVEELQGARPTHPTVRG